MRLKKALCVPVGGCCWVACLLSIMCLSFTSGSGSSGTVCSSSVHCQSYNCVGWNPGFCDRSCDCGEGTTFCSETKQCICKERFEGSKCDLEDPKSILFSFGTSEMRCLTIDQNVFDKRTIKTTDKDFYMHKRVDEKKITASLNVDLDFPLVTQGFSASYFALFNSKMGSHLRVDAADNGSTRLVQGTTGVSAYEVHSLRRSMFYAEKKTTGSTLLGSTYALHLHDKSVSSSKIDGDGTILFESGGELAFNFSPASCLQEVLALQFEDTIDSAGSNQVFLFGATLSSAQVKEGSKSVLLNSKGDYVRIGQSMGPFRWEQNDFIFECLSYSTKLPSAGGKNYIMSHSLDSEGVEMYLSDQQKIVFKFWNGAAWTTMTSSKTLALNTWYLISVARNGNKISLFLDGTKEVEETHSSTIAVSEDTLMYIGGFRGKTTNDYAWKGYLDDFRVSLGAPCENVPSDINQVSAATTYWQLKLASTQCVVTIVEETGDLVCTSNAYNQIAARRNNKFYFVQIGTQAKLDLTFPNVPVTKDFFGTSSPKINHRNYNLYWSPLDENVFKHGNDATQTFWEFTDGSKHDEKWDGEPICPSFSTTDGYPNTLAFKLPSGWTQGSSALSAVVGKTKRLAVRPRHAFYSFQEGGARMYLGIAMKEDAATIKGSYYPKRSGHLSYGEYSKNPQCRYALCESYNIELKTWPMFHVSGTDPDFERDGKNMHTMTLYKGQKNVIFFNTYGIPLFQNTSDYTMAFKDGRKITGKAISAFSVLFRDVEVPTSVDDNYVLSEVRGKIMHFKNCFPAATFPNDAKQIALSVHDKSSAYLKLSQCVAACEIYKTTKMAISMGMCLCYNNALESSKYHYKHCIYEPLDASKSPYFEYEFIMASVTDITDPHSPGEQFKFPTETSVPLDKPVLVHTTKIISQQSFINFDFQQPSNIIWGVPFANRIIVIVLYAVRSSLLNEAVSCESATTNYKNKKTYILRGDHQEVEGNPVVSFKATGLRAMTFYCVTLQSKTTAGRVSDIYAHDTPVKTADPTTPGPVKNVIVDDIGISSFRIRWERPDDDGGIDIQNYTIVRQQHTDSGCEGVKLLSYSDTMTAVVSTDGDTGNSLTYDVRIVAKNLGQKTGDLDEAEKRTFVLREYTPDVYVQGGSGEDLRDALSNRSRVIARGQQVFVPEGYYSVNADIYLTRHELRISSVGGKLKTVIDLNQTGRFLNCQDGNAPSLIEGFTIQHGRGGSESSRYQHGGAILFFGVTTVVKLKNMVFRNNVAVGGSGGAIAIANLNKMRVEFINVHFNNNVAYNGNGGAVAAMRGVHAVFEQTVFVNNTAKGGSGGALFASNDFGDLPGIRADIKFKSGVLIANNQADVDGGGVNIIESDLTCHETNVNDNSAANGGGVSLSRSFLGGAVHLSRNRAVGSIIKTGNGGAINAGGSAIDVKCSSFFANEARDDGGAIYAIFSTITLQENTTCASNIAERGNGGAISFSMRSSCRFSSTSFSNNKASDGEGGDLHGKSSNELQIVQSVLGSGSFAKHGGCVSVESTDQVTIEGSQFSHCTATGNVGGGALKAVDCPQLRVSSTVFENNHAENGGGGSILWDMRKAAKEVDYSPLKLLNDYVFRNNAALYGDNVASGPYAIVQSDGTCEDGKEITFESNDFSKAKLQFQTTSPVKYTCVEHGVNSGNIIAGVRVSESVFPTFTYVDYYGHIVTSKITDELTVDISAQRVTWHHPGDETVFKTLYSSPSFMGKRSETVTNGIAMFKNLQLKGIPGESYNGTLSSNLVSQIFTKFQVKLKQCPKGTLIDPAGQESCVRCAAGRFSSTVNAFHCDDCPVGKYSEDRAGSCTACPQGKYQNIVGIRSCNLVKHGEYPVNCSFPNNVTGCIHVRQCPKGHYCTGTKESNFVPQPCDPGTYASTEGQRECRLCPAVNTYANASGRDSCSTCATGFFQNEAGKSSCKACQPGQFRDAGMVSCEQCKKGTTPNLSGAGCESCPSGTFSEKAGSNCTLCAPGRYSKVLSIDDALVECKACDVGRHTAGMEGADGCLLCSQGQFAEVSGQSFCKECSTNTFQPEQEGRKCFACPKYEWTSNQTGSTNCTKCEEGSIYRNSDSNCIECTSGKYSKIAGEELETCHICPSGGDCPGKNVIVPKSGWWISGGKPTDGCSFSASNPPVQCGTGEMECMQSEFEGMFINKCGAKQKLIKCSLQRIDGKLPQICNPVVNHTSFDRRFQCLCNVNECYSGKLCETCAPGFAKLGKYECRKCHPKGISIAIFAAMFLLLCVVMAGYIFVMMESVGLSETTSSGVKIVVNALQLASLSAGFPMQWPAAIMDLFSAFGSASSSSDQVLQFDCVLDSRNGMPLVYQKAIIIAFLPFVSIGMCFAIMWFAIYRNRKPRFNPEHTKISEDEHDQYHNELLRRKREKDALINEVFMREKRLAHQYKYYLRENPKQQHTPQLEKKAIQLLRAALKRGESKGIDIRASIKHFKHPSTNMLDIRHVIHMLKEWDIGLTDADLESIRALLDFDGDCQIDSFELLQYRHTMKDQLTLAFSLIWYMEYPMLTTTAFKLLGCRGDLEDGSHAAYLRSDYEVPCYDTAHNAITILVAVPMLLCYTVGLPLGTLIALLSYRGRARRSDVVRFKFGLFTDGYRNDRIWWETIVALRKACVIMVSVFLSTYGALQQAYIGILIIGLFLAVQLYERPYNHAILNDLETFGMLTCFVTLYGGLLFYMNVLATAPVLMATELFIIIINGVFLLFAASELMLGYAEGVTDNDKLLHFIIKYHRALHFCCFFSKTNDRVDAIHAKLQNRLTHSLDSHHIVNKFSKKMIQKSATHRAHSNTKVSPLRPPLPRKLDDGVSKEQRGAENEGHLSVKNWE